ncbi:N-acetylmuramoyl-L-alanine amidase [Streptomyces rochei]|uniref:peptidoglycan recognition protein family protein n=1 Tax=Streptomyces TaxID=1883 RepID=UPI001CBEC689|nr:N-acetylmuramoyl-L-alanine amidase [Streptomyces sp. A144]UAX56818.1 N-acetylmuramoyl-L-alanine amidase [Streptomyces sp. A144]
MATPMTPAQFARAFRDEGLTVVEVGDWEDHNRNHTGPFGPMRGVMIHHTVTRGAARTVEICRNGYSGLPGPLCHGVITKDGRVHLVGYGRANHAGLGDDDVLRAVTDERQLPAANEANTDGNRYFYGFECENLGDGEDPWPAAQLEAIERAAAAICRHHGWNERSVIGHLEWQPGKVDPRGFTMASMRARIRARLEGQPTHNPSQQEDDVPRYLSVGMTKPLTLKPGTWATLTWDTEWADQDDGHPDRGQTFAHNAHYNGSLHIQAHGVSRGNEIQVRLVEDDMAGRTVKHFRPDEVLGTSGDTYGWVPIVGAVGEDRKVKAQVIHFGAGPITIERAEIKAHIWPR